MLMTGLFELWLVVEVLVLSLSLVNGSVWLMSQLYPLVLFCFLSSGPTLFRISS